MSQKNVKAYFIFLILALEDFLYKLSFNNWNFDNDLERADYIFENVSQGFSSSNFPQGQV